MNRFFAAAAVALSLSALAVAPALAQDMSQRVPYADLDLNSTAGARALLTRIAEAARNVCGDYRGGVVTVSQRGAIRRCVEETTRRTVTQLNHPTVTALYENNAPATLIAGR